MKQPVIFAVASLSVLALTATSSALNVECVHSDLLALDDVGVQVLMPRAASDLVGRRTALVSPQQLEMLLKQPGVKVDGNTVQRIDGDGSQWKGPFVWQKYELVNVPLAWDKLLVVSVAGTAGYPYDTTLDFYDLKTERMVDLKYRECSIVHRYMFTDGDCQSVPQADHGALIAPFHTPSGQLPSEREYRLQCKRLDSPAGDDLKDDSGVPPELSTPTRRLLADNQRRSVLRRSESWDRKLSKQPAKLRRRERPPLQFIQGNPLEILYTKVTGEKKTGKDLSKLSFALTIVRVSGDVHSAQDLTWTTEDESAVNWRPCSPLAAPTPNEARLQLVAGTRHKGWAYALTNTSSKLIDHVNKAQLIYISNASVCRSQTPAFLEKVEFLARDDAFMCSLKVQGECGCYTGKDGTVFVRCDNAVLSGTEVAQKEQVRKPKHSWCDALPRTPEQILSY